jgi:hypothetical protein
MSPALWIGLILVIVVIAGIALMARKVAKKRRLPPASAKRHAEAWRNVLAIQDDHRKIVEAEKVIESALKELGYQGSFADKLRAAGPRFSDAQALWSAHKLRNRIAHEMGVNLAEREVRSSLAAFERALKDLC